MNTTQQKLLTVIKSYARKTKTLQVRIDTSIINEPVIFETGHECQKFHSASVGKLMTMVLVVQTIESGMLDWDSPIAPFFQTDYLNRLFESDGKDYQNDVTISHLLSHTSGINDYFEGKSDLNPSFLDIVLRDHDRFFTPNDLIDVTRNHQKAIGRPGERFLYSDTGFVLLGLLLERIHQKPFHELLSFHIFDPLGMNDTTFMFYDPRFNQDELAPVIVRNQDIKSYKSLSLDFSGGGLSTTVSDLSKFMKALRDSILISTESYQHITRFNHRFVSGMYYGLGLMELRFEKVFFLLKGYPRFHGHLGVLGVHAWFDVEHGDIYIINLGNLRDMAKSFQLLIKLVSIIKKDRQEQEHPSTKSI